MTACSLVESRTCWLYAVAKAGAKLKPRPKPAIFPLTNASNFAIRSLLTYKRGQRTRFPNFQFTIKALAAPYVLL